MTSTTGLLTSACLLVLVAFVQRSEQVVGGTQAADGAYPYLVSIRRFGQHYCGATIMNSRWILTAGHCIFNQTSETIDVLVGTNDQNGGGSVYTVDTIVLHENYQYVTDQIAVNDIGLIKLNRDIPLGRKASTVNLDPNPITTQTRAIIPGWGRQSFSQGPSRFIRQLPVKTINNVRCSQQLPERTVNEDNICVAAAAQKGACFGDSGTPLVDKDTGKQIGLLAWVVSPCATGQPDGFMRISSYIGWINGKLLGSNPGGGHHHHHHHHGHGHFHPGPPGPVRGHY